MFYLREILVVRGSDASFWLHLTDDKLEGVLISGLLVEEGVVRINDEKMTEVGKISLA